MTMTQSEIDTFLSGVYLARVATVRADDRPHVVPVWYLWEDGILYFETARTSVKVKNLQANSNIAITVDVTAGGLRLRYVIMEGQAEFIEDADSARALAERIYARYVGAEGLETPTVQKMLDGDYLIVRLKPARFITMDQLDPSQLTVV